MQGKNTNTILYKDILAAFMSKLDNCERKVRLNNVPISEELSLIVVVNDEEQVLPDLQNI